MAFSLPASVCQLISRLESAGYEAYAVGGCVRDMLCGRTPHDWDLCTSAMPWETKACFPDCTVLTIGEKHGTITVLWNGEPYEITTLSGRRHIYRLPQTGRGDLCPAA